MVESLARHEAAEWLQGEVEAMDCWLKEQLQELGEEAQAALPKEKAQELQVKQNAMLCVQSQEQIKENEML